MLPRMTAVANSGRKQRQILHAIRVTCLGAFVLRENFRSKAIFEYSLQVGRVWVAVILTANFSMCREHKCIAMRKNREDVVGGNG